MDITGFDLHTWIWIVIAVFVVIWLIGLITRGAKRLIHIFLIIAAVLLVYTFFIR